MDRNDAMQLALGYAWAAEDFAGTKTTVPEGEISGPYTFAQAFAAGWDDYNQERRGHMIPVADAYAAWQASKGTTIDGERFRGYRSTLWAVQAQVETREGDWSGSRQVPTFYLDSRIQGFTDEAGAALVAARVVDAVGGHVTHISTVRV